MIVGKVAVNAPQSKRWRAGGAALNIPKRLAEAIGLPARHVKAPKAP